MRLKRLKQIIIRVDSNELTKIDSLARARKMRRATFIRAAALDRIPPYIPSINREALTELGRIGNNLNQLAGHANAGDRAALDDLQHQLGALRLALMESSPS